MHLKELIENAGLSDQIQLCIVQTAYANGSSTNYIEKVMVSGIFILYYTYK